MNPLPTFSLEAEQAVLGALMLEEPAWERVAGTVVADDFFQAEHRLIFVAIATLEAARLPRDALTVAETLASNGQLEAAGGMAYIGELVQHTPSAINVGAYAEIVHTRRQQRALLGAYRLADQFLHDGTLSAAQRAEKVAERLLAAVQGPASHQPEALPAILARTLARIDRQAQSPGPTGTPTGYPELDQHTGGLQPGELIVLAARPAMGKTTLAMNLVEQVAAAGQPVLVFSLEMATDSLMLRSLAAQSGISLRRLRDGKLDDSAWEQLTEALRTVQHWPLTIDDSPALTPAELHQRARRVARRHGGRLGLIMVDYLQLLHAPAHAGNRTQEIAEVSRALKALAKDMHCPVLALSQLNRSLEYRPDKRPVLADLRESGAIEQDADLILFLYRDVVYHPDTAHPTLAELIIGKQRNGISGVTIPLRDSLACSRFLPVAVGDIPAGWGRAVAERGEWRGRWREG